MARAREFYAGAGKTDPKDAIVLADIARAHPSRVVWLEPTSEALAHLELLCGYDADLRGDANRLSNRLRELLLTYWPALERAVGERLDSRGVLVVLGQYPSGPAIRAAGAQRLAAALKAQRVRRAELLASQLHQAALAQTVSISGAHTSARLMTELTAQLLTLDNAAQHGRRKYRQRHEGSTAAQQHGNPMYIRADDRIRSTVAPRVAVSTGGAATTPRRPGDTPDARRRSAPAAPAPRPSRRRRP
jgi:hypothetical protein